MYKFLYLLDSDFDMRMIKSGFKKIAFYNNIMVVAAMFSLIMGMQLVLADIETPHPQEPTTIMQSEENHPFDLNNALKANLSDAESHVRLGRIYYEKGLFEKTIYEFLMASEIDPLYTEIHIKLTTLLGKEDKTADTPTEPSHEYLCSIKAQKKIECSPLGQIGAGNPILILGTIPPGENNINFYTEAGILETVNIPDALSMTDGFVVGNALNDISTKKSNLTNSTFIAKHLLHLKDIINRVENKLFGQRVTKDRVGIPLFIIRILTFVTVGLVAYTAFNLLPGKATPTQQRLVRLRYAAGTRKQKKTLSQSKRKEVNYIKERLYSLGQLIVPRSEEARTKMKMELARAGYRRSDAVALYSGIKMLFALAFMGGFIMAGIAMTMKPSHLIFFGLATAGLGMYIPILWVRHKSKKRKTTLLSGFPDALDLLAVCVDAGLGLDAAVVKVADEIHHANKCLSEEFQLLNLEIRAGKPRSEALHNLGQRTGIDDIQSLVAMLIQADKFGTSIAKSLKIHSDASRTKRRLKAEEMAAKTTVKMVFPLLLFILPALFVIVMAPAVLQIIQNMGGSMK